MLSSLRDEDGIAELFRRSRGTPLCYAGAVIHSGVTQTKWPPPNPAQFIGVDCVRKLACQSILYIVCVCINRIGTRWSCFYSCI